MEADMFQNEPFRDFGEPSVRANFNGALARLETRLTSPIVAQPLVRGRRHSTGKTIRRVDPSRTSITLGEIHLAEEKLAEETLQSLASSSAPFRRLPTEARTKMLRKLADLMRQERDDLSALIVREVGKPWREADADVCEAIDFCEYYAAEADRMGRPQRMGEVPGEENLYFYEPKGIAVVISPWNFPLAIACGMTVAALVTGNPTVLKPAEPSVLIASRFAELVLQAGFPPDAFAFLPSPGSTVGAKLVSDPRVALICFTGSKEVGLNIIENAARVHPGQSAVKRVIAEMGGKNAIIVDSDADMDDAVRGVRDSAFGYAGQKCSACSRLIVVGDAYEPFMKRLVEATRGILVGEAKAPETFLGPVVDKKAHTRIRSIIDAARSTDTLAFECKVPDHGYYIPATIFRDVPRTSRLWREEIFGPVVAACQARTFEEAIQLANDSEYALTGGVFSRNPKHLELARREFRVGNLYLNRKCTGALVYRQPFGGGKMSGIGSKAGGPDYLLQFVEPRTITENTMRHGFVPEAD